MREIAAARAAAEAIPTKSAALEKRIGDAREAVKDGLVAVQRLRLPDPVEPPSHTQYSMIQVARNDAWLRAVAFGLFALLLVGINTLMLKEFFASLVPPVKILGVPLPLVAAFLFSIVELIFGACFAFVDERSTGAYVARLILSLAIGALAVLEGGFYARFGTELEFDPFSAFWAPDKAPLWTRTWFGVFGPLVVLGMAFCGHMLFVAFRELFRDSVVRQYRRFLDLRTRHADQIQKMLEAAQDRTSDLAAALKDLNTEYGAAEKALPKVADELAKARAQLEAALSRAQEIRLEPFKEVGRAEMLRTFLGCLFQAGSTGIAYVVIALAFGVFGFNAPVTIGGVLLPGVAIAIGELVLTLGAGYAASRTTVATCDGDSAPTPVSSGVGIRRLAAYAVAVAVIVANAVVLLHEATVVGAMWFALTCAANFWLFVVGGRLGLALAATWAFGQVLGIAAACTALYVAAGTLVAATAVIHVLLTMLRILAYPFKVLFGRDASVAESRWTPGRALGVFLMGMLAVLSGSGSARAQPILPEPQSSVTVLVDLSSTWLKPESRRVNERVLTAVGEAMAAIVAEVDPPIVIRYLPIGDLSLAREPMCEVVFTPRLISGPQRGKEIANIKALREYLNGACLQFILSRKQQSFTDITGALNSVARAIEEQGGPFKAVIVLSDLKEEPRPNQRHPKLRLQGGRVLLLYRVLDEDRIDTASLDARIEHWKATLADAGSSVKAINDIVAEPAQIARVLTQ
ncbi:MAG TPA: hypothetical protein VF342_13100 [Alphaproteobacteria bacterium]